MKLYYIWDAYCGWSYGFNQVLKPFLVNHPDIKIKLISGGLFVDEYAKPVAHYDYLAKIHPAITEHFGVSFGQAYQDLLAEGSLLLDSSVPATAFALMRDKIGQHAHLDLAMAIQAAFFQDGQSLSNLDTYLNLSRRFGLTKQTLRQELTQALVDKQLAKQDFEVVDLFEVSSYPTLIVEDGERYAVLNADVRTLADLEANFQAFVALGEA